MVLLLTVLLLGSSQDETVNCPGRFRWDVKTLTDPGGIAVLKAPVYDSTIGELVKVRPPARLCYFSKKHKTLPRQKEEKILIRVRGFVNDYSIQRDMDYHILLQSADGKSQLVAEIPDPECDIFIPFPELKETYRKAREEFHRVKHILKKTGRKVPVEIIGVPFWDSKHWWLKGTASNGREIHPVISIKVITPDLILK